MQHSRMDRISCLETGLILLREEEQRLQSIILLGAPESKERAQVELARLLGQIKKDKLELAQLKG